MALKQTSLFDFVDDPAIDKVPEVPPAPSPVAEEKVEEERPIVEIDFEPVKVAEPEEPLVRKQGRGRKKITDAALEADAPEIPEDDILFSKRYYNIGAVAAMFKVNVSLIRYWENEFPVLKPRKNGKGDRLFRPEDVKSLKLIHFLLREKKYTIEGARDFFKTRKNTEDRLDAIENLKRLKTFLLELKSAI